MQPLTGDGRADLETPSSCSQFQWPLRAFINSICKDEIQLPQEDEEEGRTLAGKPVPAVGRGRTLLAGRDGDELEMAQWCRAGGMCRCSRQR